MVHISITLLVKDVGILPIDDMVELYCIVCDSRFWLFTFRLFPGCTSKISFTKFHFLSFFFMSRIWSSSGHTYFRWLSEQKVGSNTIILMKYVAQERTKLSTQVLFLFWQMNSYLNLCLLSNLMNFFKNNFKPCWNPPNSHKLETSIGFASKKRGCIQRSCVNLHHF